MISRSATSILLVNGRIRLGATLDGHAHEWALVGDGRILASGDGFEPSPGGPPVHDLLGATVLPAFTDAHVHLAWLATALSGPDLSRCGSAADAIESVAAWRGPGRGDADAWIVGTGFDESAWRDPRLPTRAQLDRVHRDRPVLLQRVCGHVGVANSAALAFATGDRHTDRDSGRIAEDDLYVLNDQVRPTVETFSAVLPEVAAQLNRHGITQVHDVSPPEMVMALARCENLPLRVTCSVPARYLTPRAGAAISGMTSQAAFFAERGLADLPLGSANGSFQVLGIKLFLDGSLGARTACLHTPYTDAPSTSGTALYEDDALGTLTREVDAAGLQLMVHAIGDAALDQALRVLEPLAAGGNRLRHRVEHVEVTPPDLVERFARSGLWACVQPNFAGRWSQPGGMNAQRLGDRVDHCNVYRTLVAAGIPLAFGSDCMPLGPAFGLHAAVAHPLAHESLPRGTAWDLYSRAGRRLAGSEAEGTAADFVLLDQDPMETADWRRLTVRSTFRGGQCVWSAGPDGPA